MSQIPSLNEPVIKVKFVGSAIAQSLNKLGIETVGDLLFHFPHRYLDLSKMKKISEVQSGEQVTVVGEVREVNKKRVRTGMRIVEVSLFDGSGYIKGVWFNQDYIATRLKEGMQVSFSGKVNYKFNQYQMDNPMYDIVGEAKSEPIHSGCIVPVHPATKNVTPNIMRRILKNALDEYGDVAETLPQALITKKELLPRAEALREIHFPTERELLLQARHRFIFEELFLMQAGLAARKKRIESDLKGVAHACDGELTAALTRSLPFELTGDQLDAIREIQGDMERTGPMNRLLQGEVGSGKTIVALFALLTAIQSGYQATMMAPTEVLAVQHYDKIKDIVEELGVKTALLIGSMPQKEREALRDGIQAGDIDLIIGTHAIIQNDVDFKMLGLAIIDEQHRFGVEQRMYLKEKGYHPDILIMSATPIPRTLSLTLYGDLDVTIIKELPGGREPGAHVDTLFCRADKREQAYEKVRREVADGHQAYIVCPLIEESDKIEVRAVMQEAEHLQTQIFPDLRVGLIHGRLKSGEKQEVMAAFARGELDILISTTVIEVGIDVANATVMLIEDAERFGLAQLHQLRGRIGRSGLKSYCILFGEPTTDEGKQRINAIRTIKDGFKLAEADLQIRGEGQLFGTRQSGLPDLRIAKLTRDYEILTDARREAFSIVDNDPALAKPEHRLLREEIRTRFAHNLDWLFQA
ncbi:MAG: ATP-dependent DNA helicase RecG [Actinomycetota bacterium]|nr:ATP-dependent DNA helicase RecG [Actinomycetota bacterium]